jgi:hypothetical protein
MIYSGIKQQQNWIHSGRGERIATVDIRVSTLHEMMSSDSMVPADKGIVMNVAIDPKFEGLSEPEYLGKEVELLFLLAEMGFSSAQIEQARSLLREMRR